MTDYDDFQYDDEELEEARKKEGKGKAEGAGAIGATKAPVSEAAFALMQKCGLPKERIAEILRNWAHLAGDQLIRRLNEFARDTARASAHLIVQFDVKGGFAVVTNFLSSLAGHNLFGAKSAPHQGPPGPR